MSAVGDQAASTISAAEAAAGAGQPETAQPSAAADQRVHLYEAVSARRDQVLHQFAGQRAAILKAVADQRAAALAPVLAVQAKRANEPAVSTLNAVPASPTPAALPRATPSTAGNVASSADIRRQVLTQLRRAVAADIVATLRTLVAAEVRAQLAAVQAAATVTRPGPSDSDTAVTVAPDAMESSSRSLAQYGGFPGGDR